jgi:hypothetical protein
MLAGVFVALMALSTPAAWAHEYDRDDSDHPLRYVAYVVHPVGVAVEYAVLRPIHWLVSQPNLDIIFGHEPREDADYDYMKWE